MVTKIKILKVVGSQGIFLCEVCIFFLMFLAESFSV